MSATESALPPAPALRGGVLTDRGAVALAMSVAAGAWWHGPMPLLAGVGAVVAALAARRPWLLVMAGFALAAPLGHRAMAGLDPVEPAAYEGVVTLLADPTITPYGARVDVRVGGRHVELDASGSAGGAVSGSLAGERLTVSGRLGPPPPSAPWFVPRHVCGRLRVDQAERHDGGAAPWRAANRFRRLLDHGALALPESSQALYSGFVLGDDRHQTPELVDDFRGSGLSHLLVVSGQNVAFVLVLVSPLTNRLRLGLRWAVTIGVIAGFGVLTRFEPSVLRASAMAALAVTASLAGRPAGSVRLLALSVATLVLVDPLLVRAVGFQLSVGASAGIAWLGPVVAARMPGPEWWREQVAVTVAAQVGVAPVLVPRFGGLPVVSVPANLLAVPVAGWVTTWGLPAGLVAGLFGGRVAAVAHLPTRALVAWVAAVARVSASLPLGELGGRGFVVAAGSGGVVLALTRWRPGWRAARRVAWLLLIVSILAPAVALRTPPASVQAADGVSVRRAGGATVVVLVGPVSARDLLEGLRRAGVRRIDVLEVPSAPSPDLLRSLRHRWMVGAVRVVPARVRSG